MPPNQSDIDRREADNNLTSAVTTNVSSPTKQLALQTAVITLGGRRKLKPDGAVMGTVSSPPQLSPSPPPSSSSPASPPTPRATWTQPTRKAFYQITKLEPAEMARRTALGMCTYCADESHSRHMCAQGRLMRKVTKTQLDQRLKLGVCPICGDPGGDQHCKQTCPRRIHAQAILDAKQDAYREKRGLPTTSELEASKADRMQTVEYETMELRLPTYILKGNVSKAFDKSDQHIAEQTHGKHLCKDNDDGTKIWRKLAAETVPVESENLLVDLGIDHQPVTAVRVITGTFSKRLFDIGDLSEKPAAVKVQPPSLLDTEVPDVVWDNISMWPCARAASEAIHGGEAEKDKCTQKVGVDGTGSQLGSVPMETCKPDATDILTCKMGDLIDLCK
ncbi:hypothetical protein SEPCBS57363_005925 [Sporothrix epigloea]|uniref:Uncharacterized protein n=1 Tax=Sporothrix epigloea TaxID=1892477 RepID=A0ABP0E0A1_9PEZI